MYSRPPPPPLRSPPLPRTLGWLMASCSVTSNPHSQRTLSLALSLHLSHMPSYVCAVSMVMCGITMAPVTEHSCCCSGFSVPVHAQRTGCQQSAAKGLNGLSCSNPLSLSEIIPFSPHNISLHPPPLHQDVKLQPCDFSFQWDTKILL